MRQLMLNSKTNEIGTKPQLIALLTLGFINLLPVSSASLGTVPHFIPDLRPLLTPDKGSPADYTSLCRQIAFLHLFETRVQQRSPFATDVKIFIQVTRSHSCAPASVGVRQFS